MDEITVKWRTGYEHYYDADAQKVSNEISSLADITPRNIVDFARNPKSELHKCFEWDDAKAADGYRLQQARKITYFLVKDNGGNDSVPEVRFFYKVENNEGYKPVTAIVRDENSYTQLLARARAELRSFKSKYSMLEELREIMELID